MDGGSTGRKTAIITGGASGIGRALAEHLAAAGVEVVVADRQAAPAEKVAAGIRQTGGLAVAAEIDVRSAERFGALVLETVERAGRLDYLFNNAGIAVGGEAREFEPADWDDVIDVNLRGVAHGVCAAYPVMIRQGFGHIVNTASAAGLLPTPGGTGYALTKHAVVGLSVSLRAEAQPFGVKVSVICPGFVDTPIKDATRLLGADRQTVLESIPIKLYPADACARDALAGVARNRAIIVVTTPAKVGWFLYRLMPGPIARLMGWQAVKNPLLQGKP
jgi:NAD(P)-dependent dehydrogenase (short-subunit alcohol dehydrogenase family)